jgi:hypothetical protein
LVVEEAPWNPRQPALALPKLTLRERSAPQNRLALGWSKFDRTGQCWCTCPPSGDWGKLPDAGKKELESDGGAIL